MKISDIERIENTAAAVSIVITTAVYTSSDSLACATYRTTTKVISAAACL